MRDPVMPKNKHSAPNSASNNNNQGRVDRDFLGGDELVSSAIVKKTRFQCFKISALDGNLWMDTPD
jgi:hypothetical protein